MATPHVAGAAALLAQQHPDWKADQLKNALVSTAKTQPNQTVYAAGRGPGRPDPGDRTEGVRHRRRGLRPADRGRRVEPHDHLPQPGYRPGHAEPLRRRDQPGRGQAGDRRVRCPGDCHGPGRRQHRRTREPDRDQARPRPAQRLDRCHRPRWDRHPHRGRRPPVRPEAQGHAARRRPRRAAHRRPGRLAVRRQLAIGRTRLDPGRVEPTPPRSRRARTCCTRWWRTATRRTSR